MKKYRHLAVASSFSPNHFAILAEAFHFAQRLGASLEILFVAAFDAEIAERFEKSFSRLGSKIPVRWLEGEDIVENLLRGIKESGADLVIGGARRHEPAHEPMFASSVARCLLTEASCDVLLIPHPREEPQDTLSVVFIVEPGQEVAETARRLACEMKWQEILILVSENPFAEAMAAAKGTPLPDPHQWGREQAKAIEGDGIETGYEVVCSNTGFSLMEKVRGINPDLLVMCGHREGGKIKLPSHLNWVQQIIPTRFLLCE